MTTINLNDYNLQQPTFNSDFNGFVSALVNNNSLQLQIESPSLKLISVNEDNIVIEFLPSSNDFYTLINQIDEYIKNLIIKNGPTWFGVNLNEETINRLFHKSINLPKNIPSLPHMEFILDPKAVKIKNKKRKGQLSDLLPNMEIKLDLTVSGVQFYKHMFCVCFEINQLFIINNVCQSLECFFNNAEEQIFECNVESESNDINTVNYVE